MTFDVVILDGRPYAIRSERIAETVPLPGVSRVMRTARPDLVAAVVEDRARLFCDLGVRLGFGPAIDSACAGIVLENGGQVGGLAVPGVPEQIEVDVDSVLPLAPSVETTVYDACARHAGRIIPVLSDAFLADIEDAPTVSEDEAAPVAPSAYGGNPRFTRVIAAGREYAVASDEVLTEHRIAEPLVPLPGAGVTLAGIAAHDGAMVPVVDLARRLGAGSAVPGGACVACSVGPQTVLLLVDESRGEIDGASEPVPLPSLLCTPIVDEAIAGESGPLPVVRAERLLTATALRPLTATALRPLTATALRPRSHPTGSTFMQTLFESDVTLVEFTLGDDVYAIPESETSPPSDGLARVAFPTDHPLVDDAYTHNGRLTPGINLLSYLGHDRDEESEAGEVLLVTNGEFEAVLRPGSILGKRTVAAADQRPLPVRPAHDVVYACYVDGSEVRLILNLAAIAEHGRDPAVRSALAGLAGPAAAAGAAAGATESAATGAHTATPGATPPASTPAAPPPRAEPAPDVSPGTEPLASPEPLASHEPLASPEPEPGGEHDKRSADASVAETPDPGAPAPDASDRHAAPDAPEPSPDGPASPTGATAREPDEPTAPDEPVASTTRQATTTPAGATPPTSPTEPHPGRDNAQRRTRRRKRRRALIALLLLLAAVAVAILVYPRLDLPVSAEADAEQPRAETAEAEPLREAARGEAARDKPALGEPAEDPDPPTTTALPEPRVGETPTAEQPRETVASPDPVVVHFEADSAELLPPVRRALDGLAGSLAGTDGWTLEVVGHTARAGTPVSSQALSEARARTVADYLAERLEPGPDTTIVRGEGARDPAATNTTPEGMSLNRRVEIFAREGE